MSLRPSADALMNHFCPKLANFRRTFAAKLTTAPEIIFRAQAQSGVPPSLYRASDAERFCKSTWSYNAAVLKSINGDMKNCGAFESVLLSLVL